MLISQLLHQACLDWHRIQQPSYSQILLNEVQQVLCRIPYQKLRRYRYWERIPGQVLRSARDRDIHY